MASKSHMFRVNSRQLIHSAVEFVASGGVIQKMTISPVNEPVHFARRQERWAAVFVTGEFSMSEDTEVVVETTDNGSASEVTVEMRPILPSQAPSGSNGISTASTTGVSWLLLDAIEARSIDGLIDPLHRDAAAYVRSLDLCTMPELLAAREPRPRYWQAQASLVYHAQLVLLNRIATRFNRRGTPPLLEPSVLSFFSRLQLDLLKAAFPGRGEPLDIAKLQSAIASFGAGDLFMEVKSQTKGTADWFSNGGPNSAFVCTLAEFAFSAISAGIDRDLWLQILPAACAAAELYGFCYVPRESDGHRKRLSWDGYGGWPLASVEQQSVSQVLSRWRLAVDENRIESAFERLLACMFASIDVGAKRISREHQSGEANRYDASFTDKPIVSIPASGLCGS